MGDQGAVSIRTTCRACGSSDLVPGLSLGFQYVSTFPVYQSPTADLLRCPLDVIYCQACLLVQLRHTVDRERLYREYWYKSALNPAMVSALADVVRSAVDSVDLKPGDRVVDIGANDGTLLRLWKDVNPDVERVGVDPALNLADDLKQHCEIHVPEFWPMDLHGKKAKVITTIACFYDLEDPNAFVAAVARALHPQGIWIIQLSDLDAMFRAWDGICHEHLEYWSQAPLDWLLAQHGLIGVRTETNGVNGYSVRLFIRHRRPGDLETICVWRHEAAHLNLRFNHLARKIDRQAELLRALFASTSGFDNFIWGASTKGNTLLQTVWGADTLPWFQLAADVNPDKFGRQPVGYAVPITTEPAVRYVARRGPARVLCLPWHFQRTILEREIGKWSGNYKAEMWFPLPTLTGFDLRTGERLEF